MEDPVSLCQFVAQMNTMIRMENVLDVQTIKLFQTIEGHVFLWNVDLDQRRNSMELVHPVLHVQDKLSMKSLVYKHNVEQDK